ncbi:hypothetical protein J6590_008748 [Homalodisca vitripennis]|nr:hypothetical protein J6590_008748 [Homalodisca vitripennis]
MERRLPTNINVLDAMWMITKAWSKVTETTIFNCFKKSEFTVTTQEDNSDQPPTQEIDTVEGWESVKEALELEKDAEFEDFVTFDDDVAVCGELTDADIISSMTSVLDENVAAEDDDEDEPDCVKPDPNLTGAREALGTTVEHSKYATTWGKTSETEKYYQGTVVDTNGDSSVVFVSPTFAEMLGQCSEILMDATFRGVPRENPPCNHLLTVFAVIDTEGGHPTGNKPGIFLRTGNVLISKHRIIRDRDREIVNEDRYMFARIFTRPDKIPSGEENSG